MKFIRSKSRSASRPYVFIVTEGEKTILMAILDMYPVLDANYHRLSTDEKSTNKAAQEWLEETMKQQRVEHRKKLDEFFANGSRFFKDCKGELHLTLTGEQMEWMLRVLNDIRVGSWVRLGRPEMEQLRHFNLKGDKARYVASMEMSGFFEMALLSAMG